MEKVKEGVAFAGKHEKSGRSYLNFLSASVGGFPYFFASGHSSNGQMLVING